MLKTVARLLPNNIKGALKQFDIFQDFSTRSYAQEGEDLLLTRCLANRDKGFYVDIGAHHPKRFSNTYLFYRRGWRGINIDAMPGSMSQFRRVRPRDINLELGIAEQRGTLTYYMFDEPALNGFSRELSLERAASTSYRIVEKVELSTVPLAEVLREYLPSSHFDFLSIDVEGLDLQVLRSNDWSRFRPSIVLVECLKGQDLALELAENPVILFMRERGYKLFAKTLNTVFFRCGP